MPASQSVRTNRKDIVVMACHLKNYFAVKLKLKITVDTHRQTLTSNHELSVVITKIYDGNLFAKYIL
jgi:hypothetical protein